MLQLDLSVLLSHPPGDQLFYLETRISVEVYCCHGTFLDALHICERKVCVMLFVVRELAIQIHNEARKFAQGSMIKSVVAYGGTSVFYQASQLQRGCNILVATPGRSNVFSHRMLICECQ